MTMKTTHRAVSRVVTLAAGFFACSTVHAQSSVTLYGAIDTGVRYVSNTTAKGGSTWALNSGALMGSRFGLKGHEELGNGTSANFVLESGFLSGTGGFDQQGQLFGRQAWVGLDNKTFGTVQAGRMYSIPFWQLSNYDAFTFPNYLAEAWQTRFFGVRLDNSLKYALSRGPVGVQVQHSFGGQAGNFQAGDTNAAALTYTTPMLGMGLVAQRSSDVADRHADVLSAGVNYTPGLGVTLYGTYIHSRRDAGFTVGSTTGSALANTSMLSNATTALGTQTNARRDSFASVGAMYRITPAWRVGLSLMLDNVDGVARTESGKIKTLVSMVGYQLSKRTDIYAEVDRNILNGASVTDTNSPVGTFYGHSSQTGVTLGLRTLF